MARTDELARKSKRVRLAKMAEYPKWAKKPGNVNLQK